MGRAPCCDKDSVKRGPWSPEEDSKLKNYIEENGTGGNWIALPQKIGLKRCGKSCRLRWLNYLRPNIKHGGFSEEEDNIICSLYISIGSRWSIIAAQLPGRTDNDIKNYWNTRLKKKLLGGRRKQSDNNSNSTTQNLNGSNGVEYSQLSKSALERLQLHMHLRNPNLSFYNNPSTFPKLHPSQEKIILQSLNTSPNYGLEIPNFYEQINTPKYAEFEDSSSENINKTLIDSTNIVTRTEGLIGQQVLSFEAEIENFVENKKVASDHVSEFDCFKEMDCSSKESLAWVFNEFDDMKSTAATSWNPNLEGMFQVYDHIHMGYINLT